MLLKQHKEKSLKITFFKSLRILTILSLVFLVFGFTFKEDKPLSFFKDLKSKIKVKVNYNEGPNQEDFFAQSESNTYVSLGPVEKLEGFWSGKYTLNKQDIFWINPHLDSSKIYSTVGFGQYDIDLKFYLTHDKGSLIIEIFQDKVNYGLVNIEILSNKQINYWTKANSSNWLEIVRGKIFRVDNDKLFTQFQTTVYEDRIPIYAFRGEATLRRVGNNGL